MQTLGHHVLLVVAMLALTGAGLRVASLAGLTGLDRALGAGVAAAALAVAEALGLGLLGLADSAVVLALAAALTWLLARSAVPAGGAGAGAELAAWWERAGRAARAGAGAGVVLALGWAAWQLRHPLIGTDGFTYHLPLAAAWAQNGHPGAIVDVIAGLPIASYPVTNEVLLSWMLALSHSWVAASTWTVATGVLWLTAAWAVLRELAVPARTRAYALAALGSLPLAVGQLGGPYTDLPATAWLAACAALALRARRTPAALGLAIVAAGLCLGTKTTPALLVAVALAAGAWGARAHLRRLAGPLAVAAGVAVAVGGVWMLRNLADHGSPLWPFVETSFGDPIPAAFAAIDDRFLDHPGAMLEGREARYLETVAGGAVLLALVPLGMLAARSRAALAAGALALVAALLWASAPYTGIAHDTDLAVGATRYLLPAFTACAVAVAVAARDAPGLMRSALHALLAFATLVSLVRVAALGFPFVPAPATLAAFAAAGALAGMPAVPARLRLPVPVAVAALAALSAGVLALGADGYLGRHAESGQVDARLVRALLAQPGFDSGDRPIAMGPATVALVRGDELRHEVPFLGGRAACGEVRGRLDRGWVILQHAPRTATYRRLRGCLDGREPVHRDRLYELFTGP